jgi:hypothetical protein
MGSDPFVPGRFSDTWASFTRRGGRSILRSGSRLTRLIRPGALHDAHEHILRQVVSQIGPAGQRAEVLPQRARVPLEQRAGVRAAHRCPMS